MIKSDFNPEIEKNLILGRAKLSKATPCSSVSHLAALGEMREALNLLGNLTARVQILGRGGSGGGKISY